MVIDPTNVALLAVVIAAVVSLAWMMWGEAPE
jgi:preprotein translocase subunit Sec61beta